MDLGIEHWSFMPASVQAVFDKIDGSSKIRLSHLKERIYEGFITGKNPVFFMKRDEVTSLRIEPELIKPVPKGKNVRRYMTKWNDEFVLFPHKRGSKGTECVDLSKYPNAANHLQQHKELLLKRKYVTEAGKK